MIGVVSQIKPDFDRVEQVLNIITFSYNFYNFDHSFSITGGIPTMEGWRTLFSNFSFLDTLQCV